MIDAATFGAPNWLDLTTPDIEAATRFYRELFGWEITVEPSPMGEYHLAQVGDGQQVAGMMQAGPGQEEMPAVWSVFFHVEDVDATVVQADGAGGQLLEPPFALPDGTRIAVVADPTGAMFGLASGDPAAGRWLGRDPGRVCWVELMSRDPAAAETFYATLFGWKATTEDTAGTAYTTYTLDDEPVAGMMLMPETVPAEVPSYWGAYVAVADCAASVARACELGATVDVPATTIPPGRFAVLTDPTGAVFQLMEYAG